MAISVKYDIFLKKLRERDIGNILVSLWEELGGNIYRLAGNVGIGLDTPLEKLHVLGNILSNKTISLMTASDGVSFLAKKGNSFTAYAFAVRKVDTSNYLFAIKVGSTDGNIRIEAGDKATLGQLHSIIYLDKNGTLGIKGMPDTDFHVHGYSKLGDDVDTPSIKVKTLTTTTSPSQGGSSAKSHDIDDINKIISITVLVQVLINEIIPPIYVHDNGKQFDWDIDSSDISINNSNSNSYNILSKGVIITIIWKE